MLYEVITLPGVVRIPGCEPFSTYELWMLTHPDLRDTARHRVFRDFIADLFARRVITSYSIHYTKLYEMPQTTVTMA